MDERVGQPVTCGEFRDQLFHFQADELPEEVRTRLQEHLNRCGDCASRLELENRLLASLKSALPREKASAGLDARIRQALAGSGAGDSGGQVVGMPRPWWKHPAVAALAAVFLLAALITPVLVTRNLVPEPAVFTGTIVDFDCDRAGMPLELQRRCTARSHLNALKLDDGAYVHFNDHQADYRNLVSDLEMRGHRVTVHGTLHPEIRTLEIVGLEDLTGRL
jgi:hypothetical protein